MEYIQLEIPLQWQEILCLDLPWLKSFGTFVTNNLSHFSVSTDQIIYDSIKFLVNNLKFPWKDELSLTHTSDIFYHRFSPIKKFK